MEPPSANHVMVPIGEPEQRPMNVSLLSKPDPDEPDEPELLLPLLELEPLFELSLLELEPLLRLPLLLLLSELLLPLLSLPLLEPSLLEPVLPAPELVPPEPDDPEPVEPPVSVGDRSVDGLALESDPIAPEPTIPGVPEAGVAVTAATEVEGVLLCWIVPPFATCEPTAPMVLPGAEDDGGEPLRPAESVPMIPEVAAPVPTAAKEVDRVPACSPEPPFANCELEPLPDCWLDPLPDWLFDDAPDCSLEEAD